MMITKRKLHASLVFTAAAALVACGDGNSDAHGGNDQESVTLTLAHYLPGPSYFGGQLDNWAESLNEMTDTEIVYESFPGETLLGTGDIFDGVSSGIADVGWDATGHDPARFPFSSAINLPVGFDSSETASAVFLQLIDEFEPQEFDGYQVIAAVTNEPGYIQTTRPVTSLQDLNNFELRANGSVLETMEALGASPVSMPMGDVPEAMQTGVIDGYATSREVLEDFQLAELVTHVTDYALGTGNAHVVVMDLDYFESLPDDVQEAILELREEFSRSVGAGHDGANVGGALEWAAEEHGVETVELDDGETEEWDRLLEGVVQEWIQDHQGHDFDPQQVVDRMLELQEEYSTQATD